MPRALEPPKDGFWKAVTGTHPACLRILPLLWKERAAIRIVTSSSGHPAPQGWVVPCRNRGYTLDGSDQRRAALAMDSSLVDSWDGDGRLDDLAELGAGERIPVGGGLAGTASPAVPIRGLPTTWVVEAAANAWFRSTLRRGTPGI